LTTKFLLIFPPEFRFSVGRNATNLQTVATKHQGIRDAIAEIAWDSNIGLGRRNVHLDRSALDRPAGR